MATEIEPSKTHRGMRIRFNKLGEKREERTRPFFGSSASVRMPWENGFPARVAGVSSTANGSADRE